MSDVPQENDPCQPESDKQFHGRTGQGVTSVLPYLHKQTRTKIPVPLDELELPPELQRREQGTAET